MARQLARHSPLLDLVVTLDRIGFLLYTGLSPDAPGKVLVDSYAYEYLEIAAYRMLAHAARLQGDLATNSAALQILADEQEMAKRPQASFDGALGDSQRPGRCARQPASPSKGRLGIGDPTRRAWRLGLAGRRHTGPGPPVPPPTGGSRRRRRWQAERLAHTDAVFSRARARGSA